MEIFQTIWTALTTENELLTNLLYLPVMLIESSINTLLFTTLLNINISKRQRIRYIIIVSFVLYLTGIFISNPLKSCINFVIIILFIHFILNVSILKSVLCTIIPILISVFCESIITKLLSLIIGSNSILLVSIPIYRLPIALTIQFLVFIFYLIIKYFKIQISLLESMSKKIKIILTINYVFAFLSIIIQFYITGFYLNNLPIYIVIFSNISLILYFLLSIYSITKTVQLEITTLNLEQEKEHNRILKLAQDDIRGFRHDFANIMCTIGGYVQVKDMNGLSNYYSQIQKDISKVNNLGSLDPAVINHPAIFTLMVSKFDKAVENDITMNINCFLDLNSLNMKIYEFTRILGILLDNSIEAAKECEEKIINLEIRIDHKRNRQLLIVENTYRNKDIDTEKIYEKNYSTKKGNSGLGLWEVGQILKRNHNLNLFTTKDERFFKQQLEMYNN